MESVIATVAPLVPTAAWPEVFVYNQHFVAMMNIINAARRNNIEGQFEKHHIIPRCYFRLKGLPVDNSDENLVNLTYEEHAKVHALAALCATEQTAASLKYAAAMMQNSRHAVLLGKNNPFYGQHHDDAKKEYWSKIRKGRKLSDEHKQHLSVALKGKQRTEETKANMKAGAKKIHDRPWLRRSKSDEWKIKMSEIMKAKWRDKHDGIGNNSYHCD